MNLGIYVKHLGPSEELDHAVKNINEGITKGLLDDASIFYESVGNLPREMKCGCFNSTDVWNFTGRLIVTSIDAAKTVSNVINKFKIYFYYKWGLEKDLIGLMSVVNNPNVKIICRTPENAKDFYRLTGKTPVATIADFNITQILGMEEHE
jgi:hypothetical protein